jgi:hypothetical protein
MEVGFNWWRERVGRTSLVVEAGVEKEWAHSMDLAVGEASTVGEAVGVASR